MWRQEECCRRNYALFHPRHWLAKKEKVNQGYSGENVLPCLLIYCCNAALYKNLSTWKTDSRKGTRRRLSRQGRQQEGSVKMVTHFFPQNYWEDNFDSQNNLNRKYNGIRMPRHFSASASKESMDPIIHWYQKKKKWAFLTTNNTEQIKLENNVRSVTNRKMNYI